MRTVPDQAQFVVQIVFTTSSKTVGLRSIRPAPLVTQSSVNGVPCGPVLGSIPAPPAGWSAYAYTRQGDGFAVTSSGNGQTVSAP